MRSRLLAAGFCALLAAAGAHAHGTGTHAGFVSTVSTIDPPLPGLLVQVLGQHRELSVRNWTQKTVVVFGADGEAAARLAPGETAAWPDPRIGADGPPPDGGEFVRNWEIRGEADGKPFTISGFLGYRPPPKQQTAGRDGVGLPTWALGAAAAIGSGALAALALTLRRRQGESEGELQATER